MANLVSPGVSVTITDESFFIPAASATVPLFFIATADEKTQSDGITPAAGTYESGIVRTVTSQKQALELYGIPRFLEDSANNQQHGDARNEYGLFAVLQFLSQGTRAYVVRANINLDDDINSLRDLWDKKVSEAAYVLENLVNVLINDVNLLNQKFPGDPYENAYQTINFANSIVATNPSGLSAGSYAVNVTTACGVDNVNITLPGGNTFQSIVTAFNAASTYSELSIVNGNFVVTSLDVNASCSGPTNLGSGSSLALTGNTLFTSSMTGFVSMGTVTSGVDGYKETITESEYISLVNQAMTDVVYPLFSFSNAENNFEDDQSSSPLSVFPNGFDQPSVPPGYYGIAGRAATGPGGDGVTPGTGSNSQFPDEWTASDASDDLVAAADDFKYTQEFFNLTSLGANDAGRRVSIITALQAEINSNSDVRSENFEYNLVACPGYYETVDELTALVTGVDLKEEVFVVADSPVNLDPSDTVAWAQTTQRVTSPHVAYYYPWQLASNIDGKNVLVSPAGTALRTYAYSDNVSQLWFAPAGTRRGLVTGVTDLGYVSGTLGGPTDLVETYLNQGQRDDLYRYFVNMNPIVFFPGRGILIWGQKTVASDASAMDRVNVSRLVKYIKRQLRKNTLSFVFEPNDQLTRDNLKAVVDSFLSDIVVKRGLYDFASVCDETNNTPDRIDRNEMYIDIAIKPVKAAEFIYIPIRILNTGTPFTFGS